MSVPPHQPDPYGQQHGQQAQPGYQPHPESPPYPVYQPRPGYQGPPGPGQPQQPWPTYEGYGGGYHTALPYWGQQHRPPPRKGKTAFLVTSVLLGALLLVSAGLVTWYGLTGNEKLQAGDCFGSAEVATNAEIYKAECGTVRSSYRVVKVIDLEGSVKQTDSACAGSFMEKEPGKIVCSTLDVKAFDCMSTGGNAKAVPIKVPCSDPRADRMVVSVVEHAPSKRVCQPGQRPLGTSVPPLTACLGVLRTS